MQLTCQDTASHGSEKAAQHNILYVYHSDRDSAGRCCAAGQVSDHSPWFDAYKHEFLRTLRFGELETLDHPVACAASSVT